MFTDTTLRTNKYVSFINLKQNFEETIFFVEDARFEKKGILLGDYHQILVTNLQGNVSQLEKRINNQILGS